MHLIDEIGLEPGRDLRRIEAAIVAQDPDLDWVAPAAVTSRRSTDPPRCPRHTPLGGSTSRCPVPRTHPRDERRPVRLEIRGHRRIADRVGRRARGHREVPTARRGRGRACGGWRFGRRVPVHARCGPSQRLASRPSERWRDGTSSATVDKRVGGLGPESDVGRAECPSGRRRGFG